jgi:AraC-like DNA-binding protein
VSPHLILSGFQPSAAFPRLVPQPDSRHTHGDFAAMDIRYSTSAVEQTQRFAYWHDVVCKHCIDAASQPLTNSEFDGSLTVHAVGALNVSELTAPAHRWERDADHIRRGPNDSFWVSLMSAGEGRLAQGGREVIQRPGDLVLYDAARPFRFELSAGSIFIMEIPRQVLTFRFPVAESLTATRIGTGLPIARLLATMIREAAELDFPTHQASTASLFASAIVDMLAATLELQAGRSGYVTSHEALVQRTKAYIDRHLDAVSLDVEQLAAAQGVSGRTLTRAFAQNGSTPMHWLWQRRIEASYCALKEGHVRNVTEAALRFGFSDLSHFSRAFKKAYGVSPLMLKNAARDTGKSS